ncbi:hypothetical protein ACO2I3_06395 [Leptospira interrogans]
MSELQKLLLSIVPSPLLVLFIFVGALFLLRPAQAVVGRRVEAAFERAINIYSDSNVLNRLAIFVVLLSAATGFFASLWCYFSTDLPPPAVDPNFQHPLGPFTTRLFGYSLIWISCMIPLAGYLIIADARNSRSEVSDVFALAMCHLPLAFLLGLPMSWGWIGYAAFVDSSLAYDHPLPAFGPDVLVWWYSWVPLTSLGVGIIVYLCCTLFRWLWKLTAHIA